VIDRAMNTLHVFTCVDIAAVPPARAKALRAVMGAG
ncbi:MAG: ornithine-acyl-ACP acyltransferase, partial [Yoonia sp.]